VQVVRRVALLLPVRVEGPAVWPPAWEVGLVAWVVWVVGLVVWMAVAP
jgi:hypothetical protein